MRVVAALLRGGTAEGQTEPERLQYKTTYRRVDSKLPVVKQWSNGAALSVSESRAAAGPAFGEPGALAILGYEVGKFAFAACNEVPQGLVDRFVEFRRFVVRQQLADLVGGPGVGI